MYISIDFIAVSNGLLIAEMAEPKKNENTNKVRSTIK